MSVDQNELINPALTLTKDGSFTLYHPLLGEHYHSIHGAVQESQHIFVESGLRHRSQTQTALRILEVGLGTGLNALLSWSYAQEYQLQLDYTAIERYPLSQEVCQHLRYPSIAHSTDKLQQIYAAPWQQRSALDQSFALLKLHRDWVECSLLPNTYDVVYYDAFSPEVQPEMWSEEIFNRLYQACRPEAVLTTYCAKGEVRRRLQRSDWHVERLAGPPGKREILRATKAVK